jgi:hypothetical protein
MVETEPSADIRMRCRKPERRAAGASLEKVRMVKLDMAVRCCLAALLSMQSKRS